MSNEPFMLGWEEWVALPDLGLPSVKAKVDTGARTSALHADRIEAFGPASAPMVRFIVHPVPGREDILVTCSCLVAGRREVTSSNGDRETRFVVSTRVTIGEREWPIELTLTNRANMSYRMLLGRQAVREDIFVDPTSSFRQPRLSYKPYYRLPHRDPVRRAFRLSLLTRKPNANSAERLRTAAAGRGHVLDLIDLDTVAITFSGSEPGLSIAGVAGPHYDAIIPRVGEGGRPFAAQVVRQLELMGSFALNPGDALDCVRDRVTLAQALASAGMPVDHEAFGLTAAPGTKAGRSRNLALLFLLVGGKAVAAVERAGGRLRAAAAGRHVDKLHLAERTARTLGLGLAAVEISDDEGRVMITRVSAVPPLSRIESITGFDAAKAIVAFVETRVTSCSRRPSARTAITPDRA